MTWFAVYFDEDSLWAARASALRAVGFDVTTALEENNLSLSDDDQLAFAMRAGRVLVTANARDFARIHSEWLAVGADHAGIIIVRQSDGYSPGEFARRMLQLAAGVEQGQVTGQLWHLSSFRARPS